MPAWLDVNNHFCLAAHNKVKAARRSPNAPSSHDEAGAPCCGDATKERTSQLARRLLPEEEKPVIHPPTWREAESPRAVMRKASGLVWADGWLNIEEAVKVD
ncbi:hypothetical protein NOR_06738 [Metarhizium rileyi]|uniref:Uncharacterized protein n=1 Tax=Metarhizium rileyi (strain RCEF 4871) TaxID=1649241 RepID=A0A162J1Z7_METRR|nr:hypothetical protein NOR_06738 [Metarhizium rileyi RCEF 4871]